MAGGNPTVTFGVLGVGVFLVWSGVTGRDPIVTLKSVLQNKGKVPDKGSVDTEGSLGPWPTPQTTPSRVVPNKRNVPA